MLDFYKTKEIALDLVSDRYDDIRHSSKSDSVYVFSHGVCLRISDHVSVGSCVSDYDIRSDILDSYNQIDSIVQAFIKKAQVAELTNLAIQDLAAGIKPRIDLRKLWLVLTVPGTMDFENWHDRHVLSACINVIGYDNQIKHIELPLVALDFLSFETWNKHVLDDGNIVIQDIEAYTV